MSNTLTIRMQSGGVECLLCGCQTAFGWSIPTYNGDVVSNHFPDWMHERCGGSEPVCQRCYDRHARGEIKTYDHYYVKPGLFGVILVDGAGI